MDKDTLTMRLHEYLRGDMRAMAEILDRMETDAGKLRGLLSTLHLIADDLQTLEEGTVETPETPVIPAEERS